MKQTELQRMINNVWRSHTNTTRKSNREAPSYTAEELLDFFVASPVAMVMYQLWVSSEHNPITKPMITLQFEKTKYTLDNLEIMTKEQYNSPNRGRPEKRCYTCKGLKSVIEFYPNPINGTIRSNCIDCYKVKALGYQRTVRGVLTQIYLMQTASSKRRDHTPPGYSKAEFVAHWSTNTKFLVIYTAWCEGGYVKDQRPSIDRLDDYKPYTWENTRVVTWKVNRESSYDKNLSTTKSGGLRKIQQLDKDTLEVIDTFPSIISAANAMGCWRNNISSAAKDNRPSGGYRWKCVVS